ncbi:hypothetical protein D3C75_838230 [compost metagenome]
MSNARGQQQLIRRFQRRQATQQLFGPIDIAIGQCNPNGTFARPLIQAVTAEQIVVNLPGLFVHVARLIESPHRQHDIGILRIVLQRADQLVIRRTVLPL